MTDSLPLMNSAIEQIQHAAALIVPEVVLLLTVCCMFLTGPFLVSDSGRAPEGLRHRWGGLSLVALGAAWLIWFNSGPKAASVGPFVSDDLVWFVRGVSLTMGAVLTLLLWNQIDDGHAAEAHACLLSVIVGTNLVAASNDLVGIFLALELVSIPTYVLLYLPRRDAATREATIKYFLLSVFSSALVLYGMSWLFGAAGTTNLTGIARALAGPAQENHGFLGLALALMVAGLAFRITAVPFHFYAPDVFQGVTSFNAALLSFMPKVVGFVALLRLVPLAGATESLANWKPAPSVSLLLAVLAVATMFVGNLMAVRQSNLYRLMAYSSVAHAGYMLVGLAVGNVGFVGGTSALLFYLAVYGLMTIGVFALLAGVSSARHPLETDAQLRGLSQVRPVAALLLAVCFFSLTGLPPTAGFLGKLNLFLASWSTATPLGQVLAACLAANAAIAAWYYLRLVALMFLDPQETSDAETPPVDWVPWLAGAACAVATLVLFLVPQDLWNAVLEATAGPGT